MGYMDHSNTLDSEPLAIRYTCDTSGLSERVICRPTPGRS
jgi:hypothetical protein